MGSPQPNNLPNFDSNVSSRPLSENENPQQREHHTGLMTTSSDDEIEGIERGNSDSNSDKGSSEGILPRDRQQKTPTYDYAYEKSMSHTEAKLFYRHHQLASRNADSEPSQSPVLAGHSAGNDQEDNMPSAACITSSKINSPHDAVAVPPVPSRRHSSSTKHYGSSDICNGQHSLLAADQSARSHAVHHGVSREQGPYLSDTEGVLETGTAAGAFQGLGDFVKNDAAITSELGIIYRKIQGLLARRSKYIRLSSQGPGDNPRDQPGWKIYPPPPEPAWDDDKEYRPDTATDPPSGQRKKRKMGQDIGEDFDLSECMPVPGGSNWVYKLDGNSVYQVYENEEAAESHEPVVQIPSLRDFYMDLDAIIDVSTDGPAKSFAFKRLSYLEGKFQLYTLLNEYQEVADSKKVPHRDFYNVRKVDTHVHHSACMNQKHLLRFIKSKMKKSPDEVVLFRDGKHLTLREVFESINLTAYDLSIDTLDMHVCTNSSCARSSPLTKGIIGAHGFFPPI